MKATRENPILYIVIPCYNEQEVLPITSKLFLKKITDLVAAGKISDDSRVLFVNDGSKDKTWSIICDLAKSDKHYIGISQSRNRGHQNAVLAGLMEAKDKCDITISIDCDGQDDINAMDEMVQKYLDGAEVVYGVRSRRDTDTFFQRFTAEGFYHLMHMEGDEELATLQYIIRDHDAQKFDARKATVQQITDYLNQKWGAGTFECVIRDSYRNMREIMEQHMDVVEKAKAAFEENGVTPGISPIRGGTDGARLSYMGLPCPNLSTGGYNFHGRKEMITVEAMEAMVNVLESIVRNA